MGAQSKIEWTDHTFNPWSGCTKVSPGCDHCYAESWSKRAGAKVGKWGPCAPRVRTTTANWRKPLQWNAAHAAFFAAHGRRQRVFCASLADVFDNQVPVEWRVSLFRMIAATANLEWLLLTKRIGNALPMMREVARRCGGGEQPMDNVWLGATVVNQEEADRDIPRLLNTPARVRFLSIEPMLSAIDLRLESRNDIARWDGRGRDLPLRRIDWVICGGESGPRARPMHPDWPRSLRDQCAGAGVPFLFKQWGEWLPINQQDDAFTSRLYRSNMKAQLHQDQGALDDCYGRRCTVDTGAVHTDGSLHRIAEPMAFLQGTEAMQTFKVGKKAAGRQLDNRTHDDFPRTT